MDLIKTTKKRGQEALLIFLGLVRPNWGDCMAGCFSDVETDLPYKRCFHIDKNGNKKYISYKEAIRLLGEGKIEVWREYLDPGTKLKKIKISYVKYESSTGSQVLMALVRRQDGYYILLDTNKLGKNTQKKVDAVINYLRR